MEASKENATPGCQIYSFSNPKTGISLFDPQGRCQYRRSDSGFFVRY